jgi:hypothetical protein
MKVGRFATGFLLVGLLTGCGSASGGPAGDTVVPAPVPSGAQRSGADVLLAGWRWESYRGIEVGVPSSWGYGTAEEPWCLRHDDGSNRRPYVGRPGPVPSIGCSSTNGDTDPGSLVKSAGTFVWLHQVDGARGGPRARGDRQTVTLGGAVVEVQARADLRHQIVATIHRVSEDHNRCAVDDSAIRKQGWRPAAGIPVGRLSGVSSVAACKYEVADGRLVGSMGLTGAAAVAAVEAVAAAPVGGGPNDPGSCAKDVEYGDQIIVLVVRGDRGRQEIALRFDGCDHHGFDDGDTVRTLTRVAVAPFVAGANQVLSWEGALDGILLPRN